eukprot:gene9127-9898_t
MSAKLINQKQADVVYHGKKVWQFNFASDKGMTTTEITKFLRENKVLKESVANGKKQNVEVEFMVTTYFPFGPRSSSFEDINNIGPFTEFKDSIEHADNVTAKHFTVYMRRTSANFGGDDKAKNDCFFNCLIQAYGNDKELLPKQINTASKLKKYIGVKRDDKVPLDKLNLLEYKFNISFTVSGEHQYISKAKKPININLSLVNEHYQLRCNENRSKTVGVNFKEVNPEDVISYKIIKGHNVEIYNGKESKNMLIDEFMEIRFKREKLFIKAESQDDDLHETRNSFLKDADLLKQETKGFVNLYKYESIATGSYELWRQLSKNITEPEKLSNIEAEWIDKSFSGGLHYAERDFEGKAYCYDMNSMYLHYMSMLNFSIPMKQGEFQYISREEFHKLEYYQYGIYKCKITEPHKLFKINKNGYYTHYDLQLCKELKIKVEIVDNDQANCLIYEKDRINGNKMFESFAKRMYEYKKDGLPVKMLISRLWGYMCKKRRKHFTGDVTNRIEINDPDVFIDDIYEIDGITKVKAIKICPIMYATHR